MNNEYNRIYVNKRRQDDDHGQHCETFLSELEAEESVGRPSDYDFVAREYLASEKVDTVIRWCTRNIEDGTGVTGFAVQIRDYLLGV